MDKSRLFFSSLFSSPFQLIDAGARGGIENFWSLLPEQKLNVHGFEPDSEEVERLNINASKNVTYHPVGLWSEKKEITFHLAVDASTSSIYPPNFEVLERFSEEKWKNRTTDKILKVACDNIDNIFNNQDLDFLKIDVHSAEYEILMGAKNTLSNNLLGVVVETWCIDAHKGQHLFGDIATLMNDLGFSPFRIDQNYMSWNNKFSEQISRPSYKQPAALIILFLKNVNVLKKNNTNFDKWLKFAAISDVYGLPDYSLEILAEAKKCFPEKSKILDEAKDIILKTWNPVKKRRGLIRKLGQILIRLGKKMDPAMPAIHTNTLH